MNEDTFEVTHIYWDQSKRLQTALNVRLIVDSVPLFYHQPSLSHFRRLRGEAALIMEALCVGRGTELGYLIFLNQAPMAWGCAVVTDSTNKDST